MICYACNRRIPDAGPEPFYICPDCKAGRTAYVQGQEQRRWEQSFIRYFWTGRISPEDQTTIAQKYGTESRGVAE